MVARNGSSVTIKALYCGQLEGSVGKITGRREMLAEYLHAKRVLGLVRLICAFLWVLKGCALELLTRFVFYL